MTYSSQTESVTVTDRRATASNVREHDKFMLRLPDGMRDSLKALADENGRSMNAEIVARLDVSLREVPRSDQLDLAELAQLRQDVRRLLQDNARRAEDMKEIMERQVANARVEQDLVKALLEELRIARERK